MMKGARLLTAMSIILLLLPAVTTPLGIDDQAKAQSDNHFIFRDVEIVNITHPNIIIKSKATFRVNITLKNHKVRPCRATVYVFLKTSGHFFENKQICVGRNFIWISAGDQKTITIDCRTPLLDWWKQLVKSRRVPDSDKLFYEGRLGVKAVQGRRRFRRPLVDRLFDGEFFMEWKEVKLIEPVIYDSKLYPISMDWIDIPNETERDGTFTVGVNVSRNLSEKKFDKPIPICATVYIGSPGLGLPGEVMFMRETHYIVGFHKFNLSNESYRNFTINCTFPRENLNPGDYYDVNVVLFNYLPVKGNTNWLGKWIIWLDAYVITKRQEYEKYPSEVKEFWHNLGENVTFCHPDSKIWTFEVCPRNRSKILYSEKSYFVKRAEDVVNKTSKEVNESMWIIYGAMLSLVGVGLIGYWAVRKYGLK